MSQIRRTNQGGSIVLVIVVGVLLTLGLIGSVYLLKQRGEQARLDKATVAANRQIEAENAQNVATAHTTATNNGNDPANSTMTASAATNATMAARKNEDLPVTGPELSVFKLIGVGVLTTFVVSYLRSRRSLPRSL
jgi:type II secretory pathway pseudopilin PulG